VGVHRTSGSGKGHAKSALAAGIVLGCLVAAGGCSSSNSPAASPATTAASPPATGKDFQVSTPSGQVTLSLDGHLPPSWPSGFPVPPGAKVAGSGSVAGSSSATQVAAYTSSQSPADAFAFYKDNSTLTTSDEKSVGSGSHFFGTAKITAPHKGSVTVVSHSGTTYIVVVLTG
jgi:hypothetical protein